MGVLVIEKLVDQSERGTNQTYLIDIIEISLNAKLLNNDQIRYSYTEKMLTASQIAQKLGVARSVITSRLNDMGLSGEEGKTRAANPENYRYRMTPYGYKVQQGRLVLNKTEIKICREVLKLHNNGNMSANAIARELQKKGFINRSGGSRWDHSTVISIIKRWLGKL